MIRNLFVSAGIVLTTAATATTAHAQLVSGPAKPFSVGVAAGAAVPISDLSNFTNTGYNATILLGVNAPTLPISFRFDGAYNDFGHKYDNGSLHATSFTGNVVYNIPITASVQPYLIGGIGLYNTSNSNDQSGYGSSTNFGFNAGAGVTIPLSGFNAFIEARYNRISVGQGIQYVPIVFGVTF